MTIDKIQIFDGAQGTVLADAHPKEEGKEGKSKHNGVAVLNLTNPADVYTAGATPVFQFQKNGTNILTDTYSRSKSLSSTWEMIFSLRYIF